MTVQELYAQIGGNYESAKRVMMIDSLIAKFIVKLPEDASCARLMAGWESRDEAAIFEGAHAMKGVCANLGLEGLSAAAGEITEEFRPGRARTMDDAALQQRITALKEAHARTVEAIRAFAGEQ
jgi:HPt (histidine-containing phosphotransfer) domain-containing protein